MRKYFFIFLLLANPLWAAPQNDWKDRILSHATEIRQSTGLNLSFENTPPVQGPLRSFQMAQPPDYDQLASYIQLFSKEMQKYPPEFFRRLRLKEVIFVKKLFYKNKPVEGAYDPVHNRIYLDFLRSKTRLTQQHNIHHEFFHVIDVQHAGNSRELNDENWSQLNPEGFHYGKNENEIPSRDRLNIFDNPIKGFMTPYAMTSEEEDKAEIFACLMMKSQHQLLLRWAANDAVLNAKISYMKNFLYQFCEAIDGNFWKNLFSDEEGRAR